VISTADHWKEQMLLVRTETGAVVICCSSGERKRVMKAVRSLRISVDGISSSLSRHAGGIAFAVDALLALTALRQSEGAMEGP